MSFNFSRSVAAAGIVVALATSPALADRVMSGSEVHQLLAGQTFDFNCVDGTRGEASYNRAGVATASYRLPSAGDDAAMQKDHGRVRAEGENLCIRWNSLNGGEEGCYKITERRPGQYRISDGQIRWCDFNTRGTSRAARD